VSCHKSILGEGRAPVEGHTVGKLESGEHGIGVAGAAKGRENLEEGGGYYALKGGGAILRSQKRRKAFH